MRFTPRPQPDPARSGCSSAKKAFASEGEALEAAAYHEKKTGRRLGAYQCPECLNWHLTSQER